MEQKKIKFKYIFPDDYNPKYVNGAHGGISPQKEIIINFFLERTPLPNSQTFTISKNGNLQEIQDEAEPNDLRASFVRIIQNGIILDYQHAKIVYAFLGDQIKKLEQINETKK